MSSSARHRRPPRRNPRRPPQPHPLRTVLRRCPSRLLSRLIKHRPLRTRGWAPGQSRRVVAPGVPGVPARRRMRRGWYGKRNSISTTSSTSSTSESDHLVVLFMSVRISAVLARNREREREVERKKCFTPGQHRARFIRSSPPPPYPLLLPPSLPHRSINRMVRALVAYLYIGCVLMLPAWIFFCGIRQVFYGTKSSDFDRFLLSSDQGAKPLVVMVWLGMKSKV